MSRLDRHEVRAKDTVGDWCQGFLRYDYKTNKYYVYNQNGEWEVSNLTICRNTGFHSRLGEVDYGPIHEFDIVQLTWRSDKKEFFLMYYCNEMNCLSAMPLTKITDRNMSFFVGDRTDMMSMDTFSFIMQDPWGDVRSVEIIGNILDDSVIIEGVSGDKLLL